MSAIQSATEAQLEVLAHAIEGRSDAARLFYDLAESQWQAGDPDGYARFFRRAFLLQPVSHIGRCAGITGYDGKTATALRARARALIARNVLFAPVIAALAITDAQLGHDVSAKRLMDSARFLTTGTLAPPDGLSMDAFNRALAEEIKTDLQFHEAPSERAIRHAWRFNGLHRSQHPAIVALLDALCRAIGRYIAALPRDPDHPFLASRPQEFEVGGWAVVSDGRSYHESHLHPRAWATGVYYVVQPEISRETERGWLRVGPPPELQDAWERRLIEPAPGRFVLMPAYFWHETEPMGVDQERICIAFEARSPELALQTGDADY